MCKVGDKFVIEIDSKMTNKKGMLYGIKGFNSLVFDENGLNKLKKYENDIIKKYAAVGAYFLDLLKRPLDFVDSKEKVEEILLAIKDTNYEKGLNDAWGCAKKIYLNQDDGGIDIEDIKKIFRETPYAVMERTTPQEAIEKLKEWEEKQEIQVGDVVDYSNVLIIVTYMDKENGTFSGIDANGKSYIGRRLSDCKKTGKHIDLTEIFKELEVENAD